MPDSTRLELANRFLEQIRSANALHLQYLDDPDRVQDYERFANWQLDHLLPFFTDLYEQEGYARAIEFTMSDLAGVGISRRDRDLERAAPAITRMLPLHALSTLTIAAEANARVLEINIEIWRALRRGKTLPDSITEVDYCLACRKASELDDLIELVRLICGLGRSLKSLIKVPLIGITLRAMRRPARATGFAALHDFLENGFLTFRAIPDIDHFLSEIEDRMIDVFTLIYTSPLDVIRERALSREDLESLRQQLHNTATPD